MRTNDTISDFSISIDTDLVPSSCCHKLHLFINLFIIMTTLLFRRFFRLFCDEYYEYFKFGDQNLLLIYYLLSPFYVASYIEYY